MEAKETSTREQAIAWKNTLDIDTQIDLCIKYNDICKLHGRLMSNLTGREIEEIFLKETAHIDPTDIQSAYMMQVKPNQKEWHEDSNFMKQTFDLKTNQKQFKEFNPELFKAYINKFSDEDKIKAHQELWKSLSKKDQNKILEILCNGLSLLD